MTESKKDVPQLDRERREYISDDEESHYEIVLRYNRRLERQVAEVYSAATERG